MLGDSYRVERELGGGGMGRVFVAEETTLERKVVVKVLPPELGRSVSEERFRREIQLAARLQHPHIVPLLAAGAMADGALYYTMPFIEGDSLRRRLAREGELPIPDSLRILRQVVDALAYAHAHGVVHRDIKPDNVLLSGSHALVIDFGVSKALSTATGEASLTSLGVALGTPSYMAPEQAAADPNTDHRADIYAVGVLAYELLTGHPPFQGSSPQQVLAAHATLPPQRIVPLRPSVPQPLEDLVMRCLEKHAADRPQTAEEVLHVLETLSTPSHGTTPTPFQPVSAVRKPVAGRALALGAAVGVIALAALGALWLRRDSGPAGLVDTRVLVAPFENRTGDPALGPLGSMASEAVARLLVDQANLAVVEGTGSERAQSESQLVSAARQSGAATAIRGSYYRVGDSLQFHAALIGVGEGRVLRTLGPFTAHGATPNTALEELAQRVAGGVAVLTQATLGRDFATTLPRLDAYREYLRGDELYFNPVRSSETLRHFHDAYSLDTLYTWALVRSAYIGAQTGNCALTDSIARVLAPARQRMGVPEASYLDRVTAWCRGDWTAAYGASVRIRRNLPQSDEVAFILATSALQVNRPHEAVAAFRSTRMPRINIAFFLTYANALHVVGDHASELAVGNQVSREFRESAAGPFVTARALAAMGRSAGADSAMRQAESLEQFISYGLALLNQGSEVGFHGDTAMARRYFSRAADWFASQRESQPVSDRAQGIVAMAATERVDEALSNARELARDFPDSIDARVSLGVAAARAANAALADSADAWLAQHDRPANAGIDTFGASTFGRARIAAARGDRARVVRLIRQALTEGMPYTVSPLHTVPEFVSLRNYEPYLELLKPRD